MIDVDRLHTFMDLICDKWQGFAFDPLQKDLAINAAQRELFAYYDGLTSQYQPGSPKPVVGFEQNLVVSNELEDFKDAVDVPIPASGKILKTDLIAAIQADLGDATVTLHRITNIFGVQNYGTASEKVVDCTWKRNNRLGYAISSAIVGPDLDNPIYNNESKYYQFWPAGIGRIRAMYLLLPTDVKWDYTVVSGRPVYSPDTSVHSRFKDTSFSPLVFRALRFLGLNITEAEVIQAATQLSIAQ
jgi:hypothetical protein